jgi:AcrR family transcriptional regulator
VPTPKRGKPAPRRARRAAPTRTWDRRPNPQRREDLLAGTSEFLLDRGLAEFTLRAAAEYAGTSAQLLVHYFGTRDRLVGEALATISVRWLGSVFEDEGMSPKTFEESFWSQWSRFTSEDYLRNVRLMYEVMSASFRNPDSFRGAMDSITVHWQRRFADSLTVLGVSAEQASDISTAYLAALRGLLVDLLATGERERIDRAAALIARNLERDIADASPARPPAGNAPRKQSARRRKPS